MTPRLSALAREYQRARAEQLAAARAPAIGECRYCGKHWLAVAGSKLDGHAKCMVTRAFLRLVRQALELDDTISFDMLAEACDVSQWTARAWYQVGTKTRAA
jgi:hypothetical protein